MMNRLPMFLVLLAGIAARPAPADQVTLEPSQDAFVCDCMPGVTNPMLGSQYLAQGRYSACYNRTLIMWDLGSIPDGSTIDGAEYRVWCCAFYGAPSGQMAYYRVTGPWNESTVTYATMPSYTSEGALFSASWPSASSWKSMDITPFVSDWYSGATDNYGILCHSTGCASTCDCAYYSSRASYAAYRPRLVVTYTPPTGFEGATWGSIKSVYQGGETE